MVKITYTKEQKEILLKNKNVADCGQGIITYTKDFKMKAVKQYHEEYLTPQEIFRKAGFDIEIIGKKKPKDCLERWNKIYRRKGPKGLLEPDKSRREKLKKINNKPDKNRIKRLELEIEYLKAENDFLAKLRAKKERK